MSVLLEGLLLGFAYAMPIGAQNIFVINSAISSGIPRSYITAFVVTLMDISLAICCFAGIGVLIDKYSLLKPAMFLIGSGFLFWIGAKLILTSSLESLENENSASLSFILKSAFTLTWFNAQAIVDGSLIFGGYRASLPAAETLPFLLGTSLASGIWFFSETTVAGLLKKKISLQSFLIINRICGVALVGFGIKMLINLFMEYL